MGELRGHLVSERENLQDAGCDQAFIENYLQLGKQGKEQEQSAALAQHRERLLEDIHECQRQLDILDYFLQRKNTQKPT